MNRPIVTSLLGLAIAAAGLRLAPRPSPPNSTAIAGRPAAQDRGARRAPATASRIFKATGPTTRFTPLERPPELAGKEFFTEAEAAAEFKKRLDRYLAQPKNDIHYDDAIWQAENYDKEAEPADVVDFRSAATDESLR